MTNPGYGGRITDFPIGFRGVTFNRQRTTAGAYDQTYEKDTILISSFDFSRVQIRDQREGLHALTGGDLGVGNEVFRYVSLSGKIKSSTGEKLEDAIAAVSRAFNIEEAQLDSPSTEGVSALDFYCPTEYSGTGIASPVHEKFLARPADAPAWVERLHDGLSAVFAAQVVCPDPRRYLYTATTVTLNAGNSWSATAPNWNATMGRKVYPVVTIVTSGAGSAAFTITDGTTTFTLDLSGETAGTFTVDMATGIIKKGSTKKAYLRTSAVDTYFGIPAGGVTVSCPSGRTNLSSVSFGYSQARA